MSTHFVYRAFDDADRLLYVGCTSNDVAVRMKAHASTSPWTVYMARYSVEQFDSREEAEAAETRAIAEEFPRWNMVGRAPDHPEGWATTARKPEWLEPERELAVTVKQLRREVARTRADLRRLLVELQMEEVVVAAVSNGSLNLTELADDDLLGSDA